MIYETEEFKLDIPSNGGYIYRFNECSEQIAQLIDRYFDTHVDDDGIQRIQNLVNIEIKEARKRQAKQNELDNINGGSK
jgi:hypothetical protein